MVAARSANVTAAETAPKIYHGTRVLLDISASVNEGTALIISAFNRNLRGRWLQKFFCASTRDICL